MPYKFTFIKLISIYQSQIMINTFKILWIFYVKLLIPTLLFSSLACLVAGFDKENFGLCFLLILPTLHYFIYELRKKNEYYFFANFGFSKQILWIITVSLAFFIKISAQLL